jgi:hypothetical protein
MRPRHRLVLRARRKRPHSRAADERDELAALHSISLFGCWRRQQVEMLKSLLVALIEDYSGARINDLVVLNEQGVVLRFSVRIKLEAREPSGPFEMIDWPHAGNFQVTECLDVRKNCPDVIADDLAIVRLRQLGGDCGVGGRGRRPNPQAAVPARMARVGRNILAPTRCSP